MNPSPDLVARACLVLTEHMAPDTPAPILVAFSGGGDSLALLLIAKAWADRAGRRLIAATVDHGLQARGEAWARWCGQRARALGIECETLRWTGVKPRAGLPAAARAARHGLIAAAARGAGAKVILMGHTLDDVLEAAVMREAGVRISAPRVWSPSPVWPEGRDIFILRPLAGARRGEIRDWLTARREAWIEDPANRGPAPRGRARARLQSIPDGPASASASPAQAAWPAPRIGPAGDLHLAAEQFADLPERARRACLAAAATCVSGAPTPPRGRAVDRLMARLALPADMVATLSGARIERSGAVISITREAGRRGGGAVATHPLPVGETVVWDGRFEITAHAPDLSVRMLGGAAGHLPRSQRDSLRTLAPAARGAAPALIDGAGAVSCPILGPDPRVDLRCLIESRLRGASGCIQREVAIRRVAKPPRAS